jgi:uncharacterized protein involved in exopolysaccharide biosynthesis
MENQENQESDFRDYFKILKRRRKFFIIPFVVFALLGALLAVLLPSVYSSSATILIEEQDIPTDLVRSTVTTYADQRIQVISQRIMTRLNLSKIIKKYDLYADKRKNDSLEIILDKMRERIVVDTISADVVDKRRGGAPTQATIAFTLSFEDESPVVAKNVANELATIFLKENIKSRTLSAENATLFLSEATRRLKEKMEAMQGKLATFKEKNLNSLPEITQFNQQEITALNSRMLNLDSQERSLQERHFYLQGQLAQIDPNALATNAVGNRIFDIKDRLQILESQYPSLLATYSENHPDVVATKREIASLKSQIGENSDLNDLNAELTEKKAELASMLRRYSNQHPDVLGLRKQIAQLQDTMFESKKSAVASSSIKPDNPAYITMLSQLESVNTELKSVGYTRERMLKKIEELKNLVRSAPLVEKDYIDMVQELDNTNLRYREVSAREMEAEISQHLETERKGERFTLIDPPQEPLEPISPNRPAILFLSFILAIGAGLGTVAANESMDTSIYNENTVAGILGTVPLASIPFLENKQEFDNAKRNKRILYVTVLLLIIALMTAFHFIFMPLDVFWYKLLRIVNA